jgi:hypothetical protein
VPLDPTQLAHQMHLKAALQADDGARKLEVLTAALVGRLLGVSVPVAKSGFQHGGDAGAAGHQGRRFRLETKKYRDSTSFSDRELLGEIDHALARDEALEAWILVATRSVPEQLAQDLVQKGERVGVPVIIIDWTDSDLAPLAALCASGPDLVDLEISNVAGEAARALRQFTDEAIDSLRRNLQVWCLGFETLKTVSHGKLGGIWNSRRISDAELRQDAAGGAQPNRVTRRAVHKALDGWWQGSARNDSPAVVVGLDGVGKTWAVLDWLMNRSADQPIVLIIPSSAVTFGAGVSESSIKRFIADRLYDLTGSVRDSNHWLRRLDNLLKRPAAEGPVLTILFDGLNQEPSVPWLSVLKVIQGPSFEGRLRVILTTRRHHFEERLSELRGLVVPAVPVAVDVYDATAGGELDQMLAFDGLKQSDLHPDLVDLARRPRLFKLVIRFRDRLVEAGQVTVHRLLWEYGRDSFAERAGRSFSETEWKAWLAEIAERHRHGVQEYSLKSLGETASRPDLSARDVYARLSDIIDGRFAIPGPSGAMQLSPTVVAHSLGAALLAHLDSSRGATFAETEGEVAAWLDPIAGLDQRAEILRASVSILIERGGPTGSPIAGALVTAWLQSQNVTDTHRRELAALAPNVPEALLDAVEQSDAHSQASARLWAVNALRAIPRTENAPLPTIVARTRTWLSIVSRDVDNRADADPAFERQRSDRYKARVGVDESGPLKMLGVEFHLVDRDDGSLQGAVPSILEGFPLAKVLPCFETAAITLAVSGHTDAWKGLKWLCWLNEVDPEAAADALRALSAEIRNRRPENGIHPKLSGRVAALLLWLTGHEADEELAASIDHRLDVGYDYERDYLANPGRSLFALERRHADIALRDKGCSLNFRLQRTKEFWFDPTFQPPADFVEELRVAAAGFDVGKLDLQMSHTPQDWFFDELEPVLARCAPDVLAELVRRKLCGFTARPPDTRYSSAIHATDHFILVEPESAAAARALRLSARDKDEGQESFAAGDLLMLELAEIADAPTQFDRLIGAHLKFISADFSEVIKAPTADEVDALIARYRDAPAKQQRDLIVLLSVHPVAFSDGAWTFLADRARQSEDELRAVLFRMLSLADAARFGRILASTGWSWDARAPLWINHYGTGALIKAETGLPFDELAPRLAPWRVLEGARVRGADPAETRLAAEILGQVLTAQTIPEPDPGSNLTVDRTERRFLPFIVSVEPRPSPADQGNPMAALRAAMDMDARVKARARAIETASTRIEEARRSGASLYLTDVDATDMELVVRHAPDMLERWLEGHREITTDFKRRVRLAEPAYLALCEALLVYDPVKGAELWRSLRGCTATRYIGACGVDELLHIPFRVPESEQAAALRDEIISLRFSRTDQDLYDVATAASYNGRSDWLAATASADLGSPLVWRQRRGILLAGLTTGNHLPEPHAWPDGQMATDRADLRRKAARLRWSEACARHWWRSYLAAQDAEEAYAAWILFLRCADVRAWSWMRAGLKDQDTRDRLLSLKLAHVQLNRAELKRAMEKSMDKPEKKFLDEDIGQGIGPWGTASEGG